MFCLKQFDLNDFSLKLTKYLMFPNSYFCVKSEIEFPQKTQLVGICNISLPRALHNLVVVNQIVDKYPLRIVTLLLHINKINSRNSEPVFLFNSAENFLRAQLRKFIKDRVNVCKTFT